MKLKNTKTGDTYESLRELAKIEKVSRNVVIKRIKENGFYENKEKNLYIIPEENTTIKEETKKQTSKIDKVIDKIKERYTEEELLLLSKGNGLQDKNDRLPKIELSGEHHRIGVISDGHLGSKFSPEQLHYKAFEEFRKQKCEGVLHCGDVVEGLNSRRQNTQIYELKDIGYAKQLKKAIKVFSQCGLPLYFISGNHDSWYMSNGANLVEDLCKQIPRAEYLGDNQADMKLGGITIRLFHGLDGSSYATSYRLQKLVESFTSGQKPHILLAGHVHKFCYIFERMVHCISVPCLQKQTTWMQGKRLPAQTGFLIIDFETKNNKVCNLTIKHYPFYV